MSLDGSATPSVSCDKKTAARPHTFSIRLSPNERAQLEAEAEGMPLGAYIKRKALGGPALRQRASVADRAALAQILALLGQSRIANNLNQIAQAANLGILEQTPQEQAELAFCLASIAQMRGLLIQSLGLKDGGGAMIIKASQRGGGANLAAHLTRTDENEHVHLAELRGLVGENLHEAFKEVDAIRRGTKCQQYLFSVSLSPPPSANLSVEDFMDAIDRVEEITGLSGQPRAVVFHEKEGI